MVSMVSVGMAVLGCGEWRIADTAADVPWPNPRQISTLDRHPWVALPEDESGGLRMSVDSPPGLWVQRMIEERFHRDDEGRPLREGRTPAKYQRPGEIEYRPCPYAGSRQAAGRPM